MFIYLLAISIATFSRFMNGLSAIMQAIMGSLAAYLKHVTAPILKKNQINKYYNIISRDNKYTNKKKNFYLLPHNAI